MYVVYKRLHFIFSFDRIGRHDKRLFVFANCIICIAIYKLKRLEIIYDNKLYEEKLT